MSCCVCEKDLEAPVVVKQSCFHVAHEKCADKACDRCQRIKWGREVGVYYSIACVVVLLLVVLATISTGARVKNI